MATELDKRCFEHATALVRERTAKIELASRCVQLLVSLITLATVTVSVVGAIFFLALRI